MELSDGDDECNDHESHIVSSDFKQDEKRNPTNSVQKQIASQIISESVVYNNHPQIYQSYNQNGSQMFQGQNIETGRLLFSIFVMGINSTLSLYTINNHAINVKNR